MNKKFVALAFSVVFVGFFFFKERPVKEELKFSKKSQSKLKSTKPLKEKEDLFKDSQEEELTPLPSIKKSFEKIESCLDASTKDKSDFCSLFLSLSEKKKRYEIAREKKALLVKLSSSTDVIDNETKAWLINTILWDEPSLQSLAIDILTRAKLTEQDIRTLVDPILETPNGNLHGRVFRLLEEQGLRDSEASWSYYVKSLSELPLDERTELVDSFFLVLSHSKLDPEQIRKNVEEVLRKIPPHSLSYKKLELWLEKN